MMTASRLRELLDYDPATGEFRWRVGRGNHVALGDVAGRLEWKGYRQIKIESRQYAAHRLAWLWVHGEWPPGQIDHKNLAKADNRIANLRLSTPAQNGANKRALRTNTSGFKGVTWHRGCGKWQAAIKVSRRCIYLGLFAEKEAAHAAYAAAAREHYADFARAA